MMLLLNSYSTCKVLTLRKHAHALYVEIFKGCKNDNFQIKNCGVFLIFAQNIDCEYMYTLELSQ